MKSKGAVILAAVALAGSALASTARLRGQVVFPNQTADGVTLTILDASGNKFVANLAATGEFDIGGVSSGQAAVSIRRGRQVFDIPRIQLHDGVNDVTLYFPSDLSLEARSDGAMEGYRQGIALLERGEYARAVDTLTEALRHDTAQAATWGALALAHIGANRLEDAVFCSKMASRFDPDEASFVNNLGGAYYRMRRYDEAAQMYERAASINPVGSGLYLSNAGSAYFAMGNLPRAVSAYERATQVSGCPNNTFFYLGYLLFRTGETERAAQALREYMSRDPNGTYVGSARRMMGLVAN